MRLIFLKLILLIFFVATTKSFAGEGLKFSLLQDARPSLEDDAKSLLIASNDSTLEDKQRVKLALERYYKESKDPAIGFMLGLFVGFGAGHYYAGDIKTGIIVSVWEAIALPYMLNSILYFASAKSDVAKIYLNVGGVIGGSAVLFDAIHSVFVIKKYNKDLIKKINKEIMIEPSVFYFEDKVIAGVSFKY